MAKTEKLVVPALGESVTEATIAKWLKKAGDSITEDETLVELETDKVTVEVNAPFTGTLTEINAEEGKTVGVGDLLGSVEEGEAKAQPEAVMEKKDEPKKEKLPAKEEKAPEPKKPAQKEQPSLNLQMSPATRRMAEEENLDVGAIEGTGKDGRVTKEDLINFMSESPAPAPAPKAELNTRTEVRVPAAQQDNLEREERVPMSRLRQTIALRLKEAQQTAAILTTFNEIDMSGVIDLRNRLKDKFEERHGVKLGFMSFFVKAAVEALKEIPDVNASIDGLDVVYKHYYDIGVAVSAPQGLVVPIVRDADQKSFADIEKEIAEYAVRAREGKLSMQEMTGGTFTVSNGGVFGSLMSTPILNPPQSAILGMHKTEKRPVAINDKVEIRPMMYVALSYDHRIIDGRQAVTFLVRIKECIEDPERMLLSV